jgi:hypothetical protein
MKFQGRSIKEFPMFATNLMGSVVDEIRPEGLLPEGDMNAMTPEQIAELAGQQTRIIAAFQQQATSTVVDLRSRVDALQEVVQLDRDAEVSRRPPRPSAGSLNCVANIHSSKSG